MTNRRWRRAVPALFAAGLLAGTAGVTVAQGSGNCPMRMPDGSMMDMPCDTSSGTGGGSTGGAATTGGGATGGAATTGGGATSGGGATTSNRSSGQTSAGGAATASSGTARTSG